MGRSCSFAAAVTTMLVRSNFLWPFCIVQVNKLVPVLRKKTRNIMVSYEQHRARNLTSSFDLDLN
jgi:hypothetical protein